MRSKKIILNKTFGNDGSPDDVANCVEFLASDESRYITGETIHVNGGMKCYNYVWFKRKIFINTFNLIARINMSDISDRVKKIVEHLGAEADKVVDSASFVDDLGADSLDTVELVMAFEEELI